MIVLCGLAGCHKPRQTTGILPAPGEDVPILHKMHGTHSHETRAMQVAVRDLATLAQIPLADVPVDFSSEMLLVVTLGRVISDQYSIDIRRVWRDGGVLRVETVVTAPAPGVPTVMASPYCIAVIPRCDLNVAEFANAPPARERSWQQSEPPENWGR
ncbi:MAG: hypothetical protein DCC65_01640 [Planctomycetota bacterium]|nr:MAG: hypothetical protein DCC65_01640 [Planctomycetota bacterium]